MKNYNLLFAGSIALLFLASCDHTVSMKTVVRDDGSLEKTITIEGDSSNLQSNFIGVNQASGWNVQISRKDKVEKKDDKELLLTFTKRFKSSEEVNQELAIHSDTLFRVTSRFEKKFRWFYTYLCYSDTYQAINRLALPAENYFTPEDYAFIDRLPAEGNPISKADSLYLDRLNEKIFDIYGSRALFESYYTKLEESLRKENKAPWIDTLYKHKEMMYHALMDNNEGGFDFLNIEGVPAIPLSGSRLKELESVMQAHVDFFSLAANGKYQHQIDLPGNMVATNADSVSGNSLFWRPSATRFFLKDYTMYGESRKPNLWAIVFSLLLVAGSIAINFYRKKK